jgi:hypothetical protein
MNPVMQKITEMAMTSSPVAFGSTQDTQLLNQALHQDEQHAF